MSSVHRNWTQALDMLLRRDRELQPQLQRWLQQCQDLAAAADAAGRDGDASSRDGAVAPVPLPRRSLLNAVDSLAEQDTELAGVYASVLQLLRVRQTLCEQIGEALGGMGQMTAKVAAAEEAHAQAQEQALLQQLQQQAQQEEAAEEVEEEQ
jgi:hypothetical protein